MTTQYLYLITDCRYYKLGIAKNVEKRRRQLQTGTPNKLSIEAFYPVTDARKKEKYLHTKYASKKRQGEWFALSEKDVQNIKDYLTNVANRLYIVV